MSESNLKGDIAESYFQLWATERRYTVSRCTKQDSPYDFILDRGGNLERVQVKHRHINKFGAVVITVNHGDKFPSRTIYSKNNIDYFAVYCPEVKDIAYIPIKDFENLTRLTLRVSPSKNNQIKNVVFFEDFTTW